MHPKFSDKIARIYVDKLQKEGNDKARDWAMKFLNKEDLLVVANKVWDVLKKRGYNVPPEKA